MMTAMHLKNKMADFCQVTLFEASERLGGKVRTKRFETAPAVYEAGVAEIYDYSHIGPDPLKELITKVCGLKITPIDGAAIAMDGVFLRNLDDVSAKYGEVTAEAIRNFYVQCANLMSPLEYYEGASKVDNHHPWLNVTAQKILESRISDTKAREIIRVMSRSDIASELHLTNGLNALKNFLMDVENYIKIYSIDGGIEHFIEKISLLHDAEVKYDTRVKHISRNDEGGYLLKTERGMVRESLCFDIVIICLPHNWLQTLKFGGEKLASAMHEHIAHFDHPAHYLRIAVMFQSNFWREHVDGAWFMTDAFGGCCVYDECIRHDIAGKGVLNWLVAGSDVLAWVNLTDQELADSAIASLPDVVRDTARSEFIEVRVHRHVSSVNALPGGIPARSLKRNHIPEARNHPGLFIVGDYLFDSTLNGLLDSADVATDFVRSHALKLRYISGVSHAAVSSRQNDTGLPAPSWKIDRTYFESYRGVGSYSTVWHEFTSIEYLIDCFQTAFGVNIGAKVLVIGSASGELIAALRQVGFDAWGIENNIRIHARTSDAMRPYNLYGTILKLPFEDLSFDVVYETCLCYVSERSVSKAIHEISRVCRAWFMFGSITSDLPTAILDHYDLLRGVRHLATWSEWSEHFYHADFEHAITDVLILDALWERTVRVGRGPLHWYDDTTSLSSCLFRKVSDTSNVIELQDFKRSNEVLHIHDN